VDKVPCRDLVGLRIRNNKNVQDKVVGISLRRRDQLKSDVMWSVLWKVIQNNAMFVLTDCLEVHLDHVRMPAGNGGVKTKGRSLDVLSAIKRTLCFAHALKIAMARANNDQKYKLYRNSRCFEKPVEDLLKAFVVDLFKGGGFEELQQFQQYFRITKLLFDGLHPDRVMFSGNSLSDTKLYLFLIGTLGIIT
jgi:hypothetical protein